MRNDEEDVKQLDLMVIGTKGIHEFNDEMI